jgi:hypothetical protein
LVVKHLEDDDQKRGERLDDAELQCSLLAKPE